MKLTLVCDQNQNAASIRTLEKVLKKKGSEDIIVLTPENLTFWAEEFLAANSISGAISGLQITNISKLCQHIYPGTKISSVELSSMLVARSMQISELQTYKNSNKKYGIATEIYEVIKLLSASGINPSSFVFKNTNKSLEQKLSDIKKIWETYLLILPAGMIDGGDKIPLLISATKQGYFAGKIVYFIGFDDVSEGLIKLIEYICDSAKEVVASVVEEDNGKIINSFVANEFLEIAQKLSIETIFERKNSLENRSSHIAKNLYAKTKEAKEVSGIEITKCHNPRGESEIVAMHINNKIHSGARYKDFEIVVPNIEQYEKYLQEEFRVYNIPYYTDAPKSIEEHPLVKLIDKYLSVIANQNKVQDLISLNKNILLCANLDMLFDYENFCNKYGIEFADFKKPLSVGVDDEHYEVASEMHKKLQQQIKLFPQNNGSVGDVTASIRKFLECNNIDATLKQLCDNLQNQEEKEITERVKDAVYELLDEIDYALLDEKLSYFQIVDIWRSGTHATKLKLIPPLLDAVRISDVSTSKHNATNNLIIMGAAESTFPTFVLDNGILSDADLLTLNEQYNLKIRPTVEHVNELEKFKVVELLSLSDGNIFITFPQRIGAEEQQESMSITALRKICLANGKELEIKNSVPKNNIEMRQFLLSKAKSINGAKRVYALAKSKSKTRESMLACADIYGSVEKALNNSNNKPQELTEQNEKLKVNPFFANQKTSISELESYFACPYMHFAKYGLGVKESENAAIRALDIGNFLHKCLEKITDKFIEAKYTMSDAEFTKNMKAILTEIVKTEKYKANVNALQLEALKNEACRLCYAVLRGFDGTSFKPIDAELIFGNSKNSSLKAVTFSNTKVSLEGKIDRMDVAGKMVRLVDYKTGQVDLAIDNLYYGKKVQLFAYLLSVIESGEYKPAGVFYLPIRSVFRKNSNMLEAYKLEGYFVGTEDVVFALDNKLDFDNPKSSLIEATLVTNKENRVLGKKVLKSQQHILSEKDLQKLANYAKELMNNAIKEIENGVIIASPLEKSGAKTCDYCPFRAACKIDEHPENVRHELEKVEIGQVIGEDTGDR